MVWTMGKDHVDVVHLQSFETFLRPFDDAVAVDGDRSVVLGDDSMLTAALTAFWTVRCRWGHVLPKIS